MPAFNLSGSRSPSTSGQRVVTLDLVNDSLEATMGAGAYRWRQVGDTLIDVGQRLEGITVHTRLADRTANFAFRLRGTWSLDGTSWNVFSADFVTVSANGQSITAEYATRTDFGRMIRFEFGTTDTGAVEHGICSVVVALKFYDGRGTPDPCPGRPGDRGPAVGSRDQPGPDLHPVRPRAGGPVPAPGTHRRRPPGRGAAEGRAGRRAASRSRGGRRRGAGDTGEARVAPADRSAATPL